MTYAGVTSRSSSVVGTCENPINLDSDDEFPPLSRSASSTPAPRKRRLVAPDVDSDDNDFTLVSYKKKDNRSLKKARHLKQKKPSVRK